MEHLGLGSHDAAGAALVFDALTHDGPADPARVGPVPCTRLIQPGVDPVTFPAEAARYSATPGAALAATPAVSREPELACYTGAAGCAPTRTSASDGA